MPSAQARTFFAAFCLGLGVLAVPEADAGPEVASAGAWARATAPQARAGAAFLTIVNPDGVADALIAADSAVADSVELHSHVNDGGVMRMREVDRIELPPDSQTELKPGGLHVMLIGLRAPLAEGDHFDLGLTFEKSGRIVVPVTVKGLGAR